MLYERNSQSSTDAVELWALGVSPCLRGPIGRYSQADNTSRTRHISQRAAIVLSGICENDQHEMVEESGSPKSNGSGPTASRNSSQQKNFQNNIHI